MGTATELDGWESAEEVLKFAAATGHAVSRTQLVRWHKHDLLPRPKTRYPSGRRGLETLYPPGTAALVVDVCELDVRRRGLETAGWQLWWMGHDRDMADVRSYLEKVCLNYDQTLAKLRRLLHSNAKVPGSDYTAREYFRGSPDAGAPIGTIRRRLNWGGRRDFDAFLEIVLRSMLGDTTPPTAAECLLFERALRFDEARRFPLQGKHGWWEPEDGSAVVWMASFMSRPLAERLNDISDEDLLEARRTARTFFEFIVTFGEVANSIFKREHGLGFGFISKLFGRLLDDPGLQGMMLLIFDAARRDPVLSKNLLQLEPTMDSWNNEGYRAWLRLRVLAAEVPAIADLLSPSLLRESFKSVRGQEQLHQRLESFRTLHADEIDAVVAGHPELFPPRETDDTGELQEAAEEQPCPIRGSDSTATPHRIVHA